MSGLYAPDKTASDLVTEPWDSAFRTQRDVGLLIPVNFHVVPAISLRAACFAKNQYEDKSFQKCFSNLLALGVRRFNIDVYWDQRLGQWNLCPAQIPPSGSSTTVSSSMTTPISTTVLSSPVLSATGTSGVAAREATMSATDSPGNDKLSPRQEQSGTIGSPSPTSSASLNISSIISSSSTSSPTSSSQQSSNGTVIEIGPYNCTSSMTLSYLTAILSNYIDKTAITTEARFSYLELNIHAAALWNSPEQPAPEPTLLPSPGNISNIIRSKLSNDLFTQQSLYDQRDDLDGTWFSGDSDNRPASGYYHTERDGGNQITEDGWPTEQYLEFGQLRRLIASFGDVDPQMSDYNLSSDGATIFPRGTVRNNFSVSFNSDGGISAGCLFSTSDTNVTTNRNNSWAVATAPTIDIGSNPDPLVPIPSVTNLTSCGFSTLLNQTLAEETADQNPLPYAVFVRSCLWTWAPGEPLNATEGNKYLSRCAAMFTNETYPGRWRTVDCASQLRVACQDLSAPYRWEISRNSGLYANAESLCASGLSFSVPRTSLENAHLLAAMRASSSREPVFLNLNSLDVTDCWVQGTNSSCPYIPPADTDRARIVVVPTVAAVIIFVLAVLTFFVKCASNRREDKRGRRRKMVGGWEYEGVPS